MQRLASLVIATYRDDEVDGGHPLRRTLGALATSHAVTRIHLAPLSVGAVGHMASQTSADAELIHKRSGGNPFFVSEMMRGGGLTVPHGIRDMVLERMGRLPDSARDVLQLAAVIGRPDPRLLRLLCQTSADDIDAALAVGLFRQSGGEPGFRHELTRDAVMETISTPRRLELHARVLSALTEIGASDFALLSHHAYGASDEEAVRRHAPAAAALALKAGAHREAAGQYLRALEFTGRNEPTRRARLLVEYAEVTSTANRRAEAIASLEEAAALWETAGSPLQMGAALAAMALPLVRSGRNAEAEDRCNEAISILEPLGASRELAEALRVQSYLRMLDRDRAGALHFGRRAIRMAEEVDDVAVLAGANMTVGTAMLVSDDADGRAYLDRAMTLARQAGMQPLVALCYSNAGSSYGEQYRLKEAESFLVPGISFAAEHDLDADRHYMSAWMALVHLHRGRLVEAAQAAEELLATEALAPISEIMALVALGRARARLGRPEVEDVLDRALALAEPTGTLQRLAPVRLARAEAAWLRGDEPATLREADAVWALAAGHRHQWHLGEIAYWRNRCGRQAEPTARMAPPYAAQLEGRSAAPAAAADAWVALGCPYEQARALADGDEAAKRSALAIFDSLGARPAAAILRRQMRLSGVRSVPRGPRAAALRNAFGLTGREWEVAGLLAEGLTNALIARRLRISGKTVEHHVSAILSKLDVTNRADATLLIAGRPDA